MPPDNLTGKPATAKLRTIGAERRGPAPAALRMDFDQVRDILPSLIDAISDAVLVVDRSRRVVAANRRYVEAFGPSAEQLVGETCHDTLNCPEGAKGPNRCAACDLSTTLQTKRLIRSLPDARGVTRRWEATLNPIVGADGKLTHIVEVWRDITERSKLESQLSHGERLASLGVLAAGVAHEINNPLASILAGVESLRRWVQRTPELRGGRAEEAREVIDVLERETERARDTTNKLMMLAQPIQAAPTWMDVNQAVLDTLSLLRYQSRSQGITSSEELDPGLPQIWARASGIRGVLMNLCLNAVQAMPTGGELHVRSARLDDRTIRLEVEDTGTGIAPEHLDLIWDPFFTTKPVGKGTGLGLSITQRVVQRHGGTIRVTSDPGQGACFVVELPVQGPGGDHV